ncbi:uncharacterized protein CBL_04416 [Carabus blaptoides fortunei]
MEFPEIVWPSIIKSLRNFILTTFIIKPYFDRDFNLPEFVAGSKKAVEVVSAKISDGELSALDGLVAKEVVSDLQKSVGQMTLSQRQQIGISLEDIYFSFPYQIGIMFDDDASAKHQKRFVEITMVYHIFRGLEAMRSRGEELPLNVGMLPQYRENLSICNYRFIKEFTKGIDSDWTVNLLNHFKPSDYIDQ